jgi:hypothetical protein
MGAGVARQCSRNRCLARWTVWIPHRGRRGRAGRANSKKDLVTGPIRGFCALQGCCGQQGSVRAPEVRATGLPGKDLQLVAKNEDLDLALSALLARWHEAKEAP